MYNWIESTFNVSGGVTQTIAVILALAAVLLLFGLFIFILKRLTGGTVSQSRSRQPRIAVMDSATVDTRRRLVLVRRDNIEHLILIGGPSDVVVEQNIVRNAPLTARSGTPQAPGTVSPTVKAPIAPGPNIPLRPDEGAEAPETVTPPATISPPQAPEPQTPAARAIPPVEPKVTEKPSPLPTTTPARDTFSAKREPSLSADKPSEVNKGETLGDNGRAKELLRAAMQNGFNRATPKAEQAAPEPAALEKPSREPATKAPEVKAAPIVDEASKPEDTPAPSVKAAPRPFEPRDRPSYGRHSITPPASGPAARAKTALLKPVEQETSDKKIDPTLGLAAAKDPEATDAGSPSPEVSLERTKPSFTAGSTTHPDAASSSAAAPRAEEVTTGSSSATEVDIPSAAEAETADPGISKESASGDFGLSDIVEDTPAQATDAASETKAAEETPSTGEKEEAPAKAHSPKQEQQAKAAAPPLANKNPIEDEMAKLLDELGGQPN